MKQKVAAYLLLVGLCLAGIANQVRSDAHTSVPEPVGVYLINSAIAISEIYGSGSGFAGNKAVLSGLYASKPYNNFENCKRSGQSNCVLQELNLAEAREIAEQTRAKPDLYLVREDTGEISFHKLAYSMFGLQTQSLFFLYWFIFILSSSCFLTQFLGNAKRVWILCSVALAIVLFTNAMPHSTELNAVHSRRFIPTLGLIPFLHISFLLIDKMPLGRRNNILLTLQIIILCVTCHFRSSAVYMLICLLMVAIATFDWKKLVHFKSTIKQGVHFVTIRNLALIVIGSKLLLWIWHAPFYSIDRQGHLFWHALHVGLGLHPEATERYGIYPDDMASFDYVTAYSLKNFGSENWSHFINYNQFDALIRDRLMAILSTDLTFVVEALLLKPAVYLQTYVDYIFTSSLYINVFTFMSSIAIGYFFNSYQKKDNAASNFVLLLLLLMVSSTQPLLVLPILHYSVDTTIILSTTLLYLGFVVGELIKKTFDRQVTR